MFLDHDVLKEKNVSSGPKILIDIHFLLGLLWQYCCDSTIQYNIRLFWVDKTQLNTRDTI